MTRRHITTHSPTLTIIVVHCCSDFFILGVIKNLTVFFRVNSLHRPELEVVDCVLQIFNQSSSLIFMLASFSHLIFTYVVESPLSNCKHEYNLEISFLLVLPFYASMNILIRSVPVSPVVLICLSK